ncbi:OadG-related small transporter subunit [Carnobacterium pleistocenium]|nr:OadG-related small transporter subunit [Carnobacterium pleistocenium]
MLFDNPLIVQAFEVMAFGMGGTFFVLFILYLASLLLLKIFPAKK